MKHFYLIVDTETTTKQTVADFGAVIVDRQGQIIDQFGAMVLGHFGKFDLFYDPSAADSEFWSAQSGQRRAKKYNKMLDSGERSISSVALINQWLAATKARYNPVLTAYQLSFDLGKCSNTHINLGIFNQRFCLMKAAKRDIGVLADYQQFCYDNGLLTKGGKLRKNPKPQMTADSMAKYISGADLADEPHTALEDARDYEAMILAYILKTKTRKQLMELGR